MRCWNGMILVTIALLLPAAALGADQAPVDGWPAALYEPPSGSADEEEARTPEIQPASWPWCTGQKQYDCTWPQSNCETALDGPGIDCSTIGRVCGRVYYKDTSDGCCSTQGVFECILSSSCTPGGWWLNCNQLCGPCELP